MDEVICSGQNEKSSRSIQVVLHAALSDYLAQRQTVVVKDIDLDALHWLSKIHQVSAIISQKTHSDKFRQDYCFAVSAFLKRKNALGKR